MNETKTERSLLEQFAKAVEQHLELSAALASPAEAAAIYRVRNAIRHGRAVVLAGEDAR